MKKLTIILFLALIHLTLTAQNNGASAILDFLTTNRATAKHMSSAQLRGAQILSGFLNSQSQRAHELKVAQTGQAQVNVNAYPNQQVISAPSELKAKLVREADGRVYLYYGNNEPRLIPEEYLLRAMGIDYDTDYTADEMADLKRVIAFEGFAIPNRVVRKNMESVYCIGKKKRKNFRIQSYDFTDAKWGNDLYSVKKIDLYDEETYLYKKGEIEEDYVTLIDNAGFNYFLKHYKWASSSVVLEFCYHPNPKQLISTFFCNWREPYGANSMRGFKIDAYHGIKRTFKQGDKMEAIIVGYSGEGVMIRSTVYEMETGKVIIAVESDYSNSSIKTQKFHTERLTPGKYLYMVQIIDEKDSTGKTMVKNTFEILPGKIKKEPIKSPQKEVARGLFFAASEYVDGPYYGVNKSSYDISKENVRIYMNLKINDNNKNVIFQAYTLSGELVGESTHSVDEYRYIGPGPNSTKDLDFIDKVKLKGVGKYKIKAIVEATGEEFIRILTIEM